MPPTAVRRHYTCPTVLVVDDEPSTQRMLDRLLSFHGFAPLAATGLTEATDIARRGSIDAFVVRLALGRESGLAMLTWLRQQFDYWAAPVFVLTSHQEIEEAADALIRQHRAHVFFKGQSLELLIDRLQRLLCEPAAPPAEGELAMRLEPGRGTAAVTVIAGAELPTPD